MLLFVSFCWLTLSCSLNYPALSEKAGRRMCWTTVFQMGVKEAGQRRNKNLALCSLLGFQYVLVKWRLFLATFWVLSVLAYEPKHDPCPTALDVLPERLSAGRVIVAACMPGIWIHLFSNTNLFSSVMQANLCSLITFRSESRISIEQF